MQHKRFLCLLIALVMLTMTGCAKMPLREDYVKEPAPQLTADETHGLVYFVRPSAFFGAGVSFFIQEDDDTKIGLLKSGTWFVHKAEAGQHTYWAETEGKSTLTIEVKPFESYYVLGEVGFGMMVGRPQLSLVTRAIVEKDLKEGEYIRLATEEERAAAREKEEAAKNPTGVTISSSN